MLGAANTHYARTCKPRKAALGALPDPNQVFDALFARQKFRQHPNKVSSILWYWATIVTHGTLQERARSRGVPLTHCLGITAAAAATP